MADVFYWLLVHNPLFGKMRYFAFRPKDAHVPTNPALALRWLDYEGAAQFASRLAANWTPILVRFDGDAICGAEPNSPKA